MTILGGKTKPDQASCTHAQTITVVSAGFERIVCEQCAYVSFQYLAEMKADVNRDMFSRDVDRLNEMAVAGAAH